MSWPLPFGNSWDSRKHKIAKVQVLVNLVTVTNPRCSEIRLEYSLNAILMQNNDFKMISFSPDMRLINCNRTPTISKQVILGARWAPYQL